MSFCSAQRDLVTVSILLGAILSGALGAQTHYVAASAGPGRFPLAVSAKPATILLSASDYPGVVRAANDFKTDLGKVIGHDPSVAIDTVPHARELVIAGTLGKSTLIDRLVREKKLDVRDLAGRWEMFVTQIVDKPFPGVARALVIAGSDKRGTIYGLYDLSSEIGVSPWYWWADVPVPHQDDLYVLPGRHTNGEPAVKYRGIFLNDEAPALTGWAKEKFGGINHQFYEKVFELILRLKGNYLWPAMWGNAFNDDDKLDPVLADEYGIVMGTSHHEPMLRAQQEWKRYGHGEWNYEHNDSTLRAFWAQGIRNMGSHESIVTIGMRGDGDMPMTAGSNIALLERIVRDQRTIISQVTGKDASSTPQLWALYKEVQDYYDQGMRVPDDVTLLFADDNWGNIRRLPAHGDTLRSGGYGVYYHFDYVGGPRNYKWINTNPIARVWDQMNLSYRSGAKRIWIVNVGDLKPMEFPISFFLDFAWNPDRWPADSLPAYTRRWSSQQFGSAHASEIADLMTTYLKYAGRRKPELLDTATYSLTNYREAERVVADYDSLLERARALSTALPANARDAFYELVLHPIEAASNLNDLYVTVAENRLYALQGRAMTNDLADRARALFQRDAEISRQYNTRLAGGKWDHMMDQTHIGYTYWQEPPRNVMPRVDVIQLPVAADMGVTIVEQNRPPFVRGPGRGGSFPPPNGAGMMSREPTLPAFDPYQRQTYHLDISNRGQTPFDYTVQTGEPWLIVSPPRGRVDKEQRVAVSIDWSRAPAGQQRQPITISASTGGKFTVQALMNNPATPKPDAIVGFVEGDGYVSMEAEHYSRAVSAGPIKWLLVPDLGRTGSAMTETPATAPSQTLSPSAARLEYRVFMFDSGAVKVYAYLSPTLNFSGSKDGLRYAISFDDQAPQIINIQSDTSTRTWEKSVADNIIVSASQHALAHAGEHTLKFWAVDPGVVIQKLIIEARPIGQSYLGPPESFHRDVAGPKAMVGHGTTPSARFDWFTYEGRDSIYKTLRAGPSQYLNPIFAGFYPDPSITRVGDNYYAVNSSFVYFPGVPIFRSRDLVHWTQIGHVLDRPSQLNVDSAGISRGIFAPVIREYAGTYYMITTLVDRGGNFFVTAKDPAGPWSDPIWLPEIDGIDPSFFFDDNGKAYVINNGPPVGQPLYNGHRAIWIQAFDRATNKMVGPRSVIVNGGVDLSKKPIWIEAPHIFKHDGKYYLICAEGGTADQHSEVVFRSDSATGPYVPFAGNPILTQRHLDPARPFPITSTGHADFVETPTGEWWAIFLGTRPYEDHTYNIGRETFMLPVQWVDGWPIILTGTQTVPYVVDAPKLPRDAASPVPMNGNFTLREDFNGPSLAPYWTFMRTPHERWYDLDSKPGWLTIRARHADIGQPTQPSFVGRRQQHLIASASTAMTFTPSEAGDKAGLVAFQNENHYYFLGITRRGSQNVVELEMHNGKATPDSGRVLASAPVRLTVGAPLYLKIDARGGRYDFYYATRPNEWTPLMRDADGTILSTKKAGGFVGTFFGMYAYSATPQ
jgi:beta-xylosidase